MIKDIQAKLKIVCSGKENVIKIINSTFDEIGVEKDIYENSDYETIKSVFNDSGHDCIAFNDTIYRLEYELKDCSSWIGGDKINDEIILNGRINLNEYRPKPIVTGKH